MARVVLFEDNHAYIEIAQKILQDYGHPLVAQEATIQGSFQVLGLIATHELEADVLIVDGSLKNTDPAGMEPVFEYSHSDEQELTMPKPNFLRRRPKQLLTPKITRVEIEESIQRHGRAIVAIVKKLHLPCKTIGFSGDSSPMAGIPYDIDIGKDPYRLNDAIAEVTAP